MSARLQKTWRDAVWASGLVGTQSLQKTFSRLTLHRSLGKRYRTLEETELEEEWEVDFCCEFWIDSNSALFLVFCLAAFLLAYMLRTSGGVGYRWGVSSPFDEELLFFCNRFCR